MGSILIIAGVSGGGKGTVRALLIARHPDLIIPVSCTTRAPRPGEVDGDHYHFVDDETFDQMIVAGEFLEYATVHERRYGTPKRTIEVAVAANCDILLEIDMRGIDFVMEHFSSVRIAFLVLPNEAEQRHRLIMRGTTSETEIAVRLQTTRTELEWVAQRAIPLVVNERLEQAVDDVERILFT
jgi:guanylate kinase